MYKKMLVVLDGSKLAEVVFTYAQELAGRLNLCLELLHVCSQQEANQLPMRQAYIERMADEIQKKTDSIRSNSGTSVTCEPAKGTVVVGYPAEEILKYIEQNQVDLLMLATHGSSGIRQWNIGSVASQVVRASDIPVLIVPSELAQMTFQDVPRRTVVVPLDGSQLPEGVIPYAISIAKQRGAESEIVLIYADKVPDATRSLTEIELAKERIEAIHKYLEDMTNKIKESGISARYKVVVGDPAYAIIEYLKDNPAQLLAMASPRKGLSKMVFGSVTENVLQMLKNTPILLVKPKKD